MTENSRAEKLNVTHVNIRQSISILVAKIILIQIMSLIIQLIVCNLVNCSATILNIETFFFTFTELTLTIYVIYQWVNEYYEITPEEMVHRKGFIFQTVDKYKFSHITAFKYHQGLIGRILNYGTISVYDEDLLKYIDMYLIHNPKKYYNLMLKIKPTVDEEQKRIRKKLIEKDKKF